MSLSRIAVEQREKEAQALNSFLAFSLIGSLALHIGVLSLGLGKFLNKAPELENEPIEIAIVELPNPPKLELKQETKAKGGSGGGESRAILSNSGSNAGVGVASSVESLEKSPVSSKSASSNSSYISKLAPPAPLQKLPLKSSQIISTPQQNQRTNLEKVPAKIIAQPKPVVRPPQAAPSEIVTKPVVTSLPVPAATRVKPAPVATPKDRSSQAQQLNNQRLTSLLVNAKNAREQASQVTNSNGIAAQQGKIAANLRNQAGSGVTNSNGLSNGAGNELRNGTGTGNGNGTSLNNSGNGNGTGTGNGNGRNGTGTGNGNGRNGTGTGNGGTGRGNGGTGRGTGTGNGGTGRGNNVQSGSTVATGTRNIERRTLPRESDGNTNTGSSGRITCPTCKPKYPEKARKRGLEGRAEISVDVDSKGNVTNVRLAQTSGHAELDKAAVEQARTWKFNAPNGAAQGVSAKVDFAIEGSKKSRQNRERRRKKAIRKQPVAKSQNTRIQPSTQATNITRTPARQNTNTALRKSLRRQSTTVRRRVDIPPRQRQDRPQRRQQTTLRSPSQTRLRESLRRSQQRATSPNQSRLRQSLRLYKQKSPSTPSTNSNEP